MLASRFVVEFISAFPPSGGKVLNRERYERLLALSFEIIEKDMLVDPAQRADIILDQEAPPKTGIFSYP